MAHQAIEKNLYQERRDRLGKPYKKNYLVREIVPIPSDIPTIKTVSEYLDSEYWLIFLTPPILVS